MVSSLYCVGYSLHVVVTLNYSWHVFLSWYDVITPLCGVVLSWCIDIVKLCVVLLSWCNGFVFVFLTSLPIPRSCTQALLATFSSLVLKSIKLQKHASLITVATLWIVFFWNLLKLSLKMCQSCLSGAFMSLPYYNGHCLHALCANTRKQHQSAAAAALSTCTTFFSRWSSSRRKGVCGGKR